MDACRVAKEERDHDVEWIDWTDDLVSGLIKAHELAGWSKLTQDFDDLLSDTSPESELVSRAIRQPSQAKDLIEKFKREQAEWFVRDNYGECLGEYL